MKRIISLLLSILLLGTSSKTVIGPLNSLVISRRIPSEDVTGFYDEHIVQVNLNKLTGAPSGRYTNVSNRTPSEDGQGSSKSLVITVNLHNITDKATGQMLDEFNELAKADDSALDGVDLYKFNDDILAAPEYCLFTETPASCRSWIMARAQDADAVATLPTVRVVAESYPVVVTLPVEDPGSIIALLLYVDDEWYVPEEEEPFVDEDGTGYIRFLLSAPSHITILRPRGWIPSPERSLD